MDVILKSGLLVLLGIILGNVILVLGLKYIVFKNNMLAVLPDSKVERLRQVARKLGVGNTQVVNTKGDFYYSTLDPSQKFHIKPAIHYIVLDVDENIITEPIFDKDGVKLKRPVSKKLTKQELAERAKAEQLQTLSDEAYELTESTLTEQQKLDKTAKRELKEKQRKEAEAIKKTQELEQIKIKAKAEQDKKRLAREKEILDAQKEKAKKEALANAQEREDRILDEFELEKERTEAKRLADEETLLKTDKQRALTEKIRLERLQAETDRLLSEQEAIKQSQKVSKESNKAVLNKIKLENEQKIKEATLKSEKALEANKKRIKLELEAIKEGKLKANVEKKPKKEIVGAVLHKPKEVKLEEDKGGSTEQKTNKVTKVEKPVVATKKAVQKPLDKAKKLSNQAKAKSPKTKSAKASAKKPKK